MIGWQFLLSNQSIPFSLITLMNLLPFLNGRIFLFLNVRREERGRLTISIPNKNRFGDFFRGRMENKQKNSAIIVMPLFFTTNSNSLKNLFEKFTNEINGKTKKIQRLELPSLEDIISFVILGMVIKNKVNSYLSSLVERHQQLLQMQDLEITGPQIGLPSYFDFFHFAYEAKLSAPSLSVPALQLNH